MDHNNSDKKCSCGGNGKHCPCSNCACKKDAAEKTEKKHCMCPHGMCKDHNPEWETIREVSRPNPGIFGAKTYRTFNRCCGKGMIRLKKVVYQKCRKCGREREIETAEFALCLCCGNHHQIFHRVPNSKIVFPAKTNMPKYSPENYSGD
mgnify:FL=1